MPSLSEHLCTKDTTDCCLPLSTSHWKAGKTQVRLPGAEEGTVLQALGVAWVSVRTVCIWMCTGLAQSVEEPSARLKQVARFTSKLYLVAAYSLAPHWLKRERAEDVLIWSTFSRIWFSNSWRKGDSRAIPDSSGFLTLRKMISDEICMNLLNALGGGGCLPNHLILSL